jgi:hypothetical protein
MLLGSDVLKTLGGEVPGHHVNKLLMFLGFLLVPLHLFLLALVCALAIISPASLEICQSNGKFFF